MHPHLYKFVERGGGAGFANLTVGDGKRVFVSLAGSGLALFRLALGLLPYGRLFACDEPGASRIARVLGRDLPTLPPLPHASSRHDAMDPRMSALLDAALADIEAFNSGKDIPGATRSLDLDDMEPTRLELFTRFALTATDPDDLARRFTRALNTAG